jgi:hypothetical protein
MLPNKHIIFGAIFSLIFFLLYPKISLEGALIVFLSALLVDFDHYLYYVFRKKDINPLAAYHWHKKLHKKFLSLSREQLRKIYSGFFIFHGLEALLIVLLLGILLSGFFLFIFVGFLFHMILDWYTEIRLKDRTDKLFLLFDFLNFKKLKNIEDF